MVQSDRPASQGCLSAAAEANLDFRWICISRVILFYFFNQVRLKLQHVFVRGERTLWVPLAPEKASSELPFITHRICTSFREDILNDRWIFMSNRALTVIYIFLPLKHLEWLFPVWILWSLKELRSGCVISLPGLLLAGDVLHLIARRASAWVQLLCLGSKRETGTPLRYLKGRTTVCPHQIIPRMTRLQPVRHRLHLSSLPVYPHGARSIPSKTHPASFLRSSSLQAYDPPFFD